MKFLPLLILVILSSCGNEPAVPQKKVDAPVTLELFETYDIDDIREEWLEAFKWTAENDTVRPHFSSEKEWAEQIAFKGLRSVLITGYSHAVALVKTKDIPAVDSMLAIPEVANLFPKDLQFMWSKYEKEDPLENFKGYLLYAVKLPKDKKAVVNSHDVSESVPADNAEHPTVDLNLIMTKKGSQKLEAFTRKNENRYIAVVIDGKVVSCPLVQETISDEMKLSQNFTMEQAGEVSDRINAGRLKATVSDTSKP